MTIADRLYDADPDTLFTLVVIYMLKGLGRSHFPENIIDENYQSYNSRHHDEDNEYQQREFKNLMTPSDYSGKAQRSHGAITQKHGLVLK